MRSYAVHGFKIIGMSTHYARAAVLYEISKVIGRKPEINRNQDRADLQDRIERLQLRVDVGSNVSDAVSLAHSKSLQGRRPTVAALEKLSVGEAQIVVDDGFAAGIQPPCATSKLQRCQSSFHSSSNRPPRLYCYP